MRTQNICFYGELTKLSLNYLQISSLSVPLSGIIRFTILQYPNSGAGSSPMDMDMLNVYRHKAIAETPWTWATLLQGDCMFVPAGKVVFN